MNKLVIQNNKVIKNYTEFYLEDPYEMSGELHTTVRGSMEGMHTNRMIGISTKNNFVKIMFWMNEEGKVNWYAQSLDKIKHHCGQSYVDQDMNISFERCNTGLKITSTSYKETSIMLNDIFEEGEENGILRIYNPEVWQETENAMLKFLYDFR